MRFKLDENLGRRCQSLFRDTGHDAQTVLQESLSGATDRQIYDACRRERRCLVTLDLDFADVTRFAPEKTDGIIVLRPGKSPSLLTLELLVGRCLAALAQMPLEGSLWIVEMGQIRIHQRSDQP